MPIKATCINKAVFSRISDRNAGIYATHSNFSKCLFARQYIINAQHIQICLFLVRVAIKVYGHISEFIWKIERTNFKSLSSFFILKINFGKKYVFATNFHHRKNHISTTKPQKSFPRMKIPIPKTFTWQAEDPYRDLLNYTLLYHLNFK